MTIPLVMCRSCGEFVRALVEGEIRIPQVEKCPECGGTEFKDLHSETVVRRDEVID